MNALKFIHKVKELFGISPQSEESTKKESVRELLKKLKLRHVTLKQELKKEDDLLKRETLQDSIQIIKKQIKKGKEILDED